MSSEALEAAKQTVREALEQGVLSHQCGVNSIAAFGTLLAEVARLEQRERDQAGEIRDLTECVRVFRAQVARLEQERDEARKWANTMEHERDWETQVVHSELLLRADDAEAALAVAREREHRLREALTQVLDCKGSFNGTVSRYGGDPALCTKCEAAARAALADEPAAATDVLG